MTARDDYPSLAWWADRRHNDDDDEPRPTGMRSVTRAALDEIDRLREQLRIVIHAPPPPPPVQGPLPDPSIDVFHSRVKDG